MANITRIPTPFSYSSVVLAGNFVFLGLHRGFGDTFTSQLTDLFKNIQETLGKNDISLRNLVKVHVWLKDIQDLPEMDKMFTQYFEHNEFPALMTSTTEFIDTDCLVMLDGIAYKG